jgi:hypothetical protein
VGASSVFFIPVELKSQTWKGKQGNARNIPEKKFPLTVDTKDRPIRVFDDDIVIASDDPANNKNNISIG